ncbi:LysM peptidoglycan-binding domain-containing protein [Bacillus sp. 1NLA3E]|uniref:LysM peptidoglycan-binding domain-containing protein n=1 Tax=Bacillus sp. 1NLA3E TaxID=666686 RepID=UPI000247F184|nr:LysM peptidoglycan-binding domain-containing protein [Bacillus sp. 1NLA3E]AGK53922.1 glycoside hydrolase family protein [Bacillus sp. 1NLA3E]
MEIVKYKLLQEGSSYSLVIFVSHPNVEFSRELGRDQEIKLSIRQDIKNLLIYKFPHVKVSTVTVMMGAMLLGSFPVGEIVTKAEINQVPSINSTVPYVNYIVKSGDSLYGIAAANGISVDQIKQLNKLSGNTIFIGKTLQLPFVSYTVVPGDSLFRIANKYYSTTESIKIKNNLTSNTIFIGQHLTIPVLNPPTSATVAPNVPTAPPTTVTPPITAPPIIAPSTPQTVSTIYKVVSGDSLYGIAKRFNTSVSAIQTENKLLTNTINIGQILKIPAHQPISVPSPTPVPVPIPTPTPTPVPTGTVIDYVVVPSDTLTGIARKYNTTVLRIKELNNLSTDVINVGQHLVFPGTVEAVIVKDTTPPSIPNVQVEKVVTEQNVIDYKLSGTTETNGIIVVTVLDESKQTISKEINADTSGIFSTNLDLSTLQDGKITISVVAQDGAGNKSPINSSVIIKDTKGPTRIIFDNLPTISKSNVGTYTVSGQTEPNSLVDLKIISKTNTINLSTHSDNNGDFSVTLNANSIQDGELMITALSQDQYGNQSTTFEKRILKDTIVNPVSSVILDSNGKVSKQNASEFHIRGNSAEEGAIVHFEISDGMNKISEEALVLNGLYDKQIDLSSLKDGPLTVRITQIDQAGNVSEEISSPIQKDTVVIEPVVYTSKVEKKATGFNYKITGQAEPLSVVNVSVMGQTGPQEIKQTINSNEAGRFELDLNITSFAGNRPFVTINQMDPFGNISRTAVVGITSYVVGSGDTLWAIANRFNVSIDKITELNQLSNTIISVGQVLNLPSVAGISSPNITEQQFFNMGYLYFGGSQTYLVSVRQTEKTINVVSPSYFDLNSNGTLKLTSQFDRQFIVSMQSSGIRVVPFLSNHWDRAMGEMALKNREQLSTQIADMVRLYNLDGVNVDIENVTEAYRDDYTDFIRLLNEKLPENKEVSVAVAANPYGYTKGWQGSYDYTSLAKYADYLMIMAYDESYPGSDPGPIASINFVEKSIQYALNNGVAEDQIVVGVGHYGRYWMDGTSYGGDGISNFQIQKALDLYNGTVTFDEATKSAKAMFTINKGDPVMTVGGKTLTAGTYTVWFENSDAIKAKIDLVHKYGVKGLGNWSLGQDNPQIWNDISTWLNPQTTPTDGTVTP